LSIFKRLFSVDYRAALSAEATGNLEQAAERYVLAGEPAEAARIHRLRASRASDRAGRIAALRDALHWADDDPKQAPYICKHLGRALLEQIQAEGVATKRDKQRVREAAVLLMRGRDWAAAGAAFESIDEDKKAALAYSKGGLVERMEAALAKDDARLDQARALRDSFANYEMHMRLGERDQAREALRECASAADNKSEYRRLLDDLESRLITGGLVRLRRRQDPPVAVFAGETVALGRDNLCELPLRDSGISRRHAEISIGVASARPRFFLRDAGSKNGTTIGGLPISGSVALADRGGFALGDHCTIEYSVQCSVEHSVAESGQDLREPAAVGEPETLVLRVKTGLDRGRTVIAVGPGERVALESVAGLPIALTIRDGRPFVEFIGDGAPMELGGAPIAHGRVQLIRGDVLRVNGDEVEVL
jgi:tetratricopeptide (TPR) repeat protein